MSNIKGKGQCRTCAIRQLSIFALLPEANLTEIQHFQPSIMTFASNEAVYHQGEVATCAYTLRQGLIRLVKTLPNGRTQIVRLIRAGIALALMDLLASLITIVLFPYVK